jgi:hypothetical protein
MFRRRSLSAAIPTLALACVLGAATPGHAEGWQWEGSAAEDATAKGLDALVIRPLAVARVAIGAALMIPTALFAWPGGREALDAGYEVLIDGPMEYAFERELGEDL